MVTSVSGKTPPVLSATEPVMPPRVCCAWVCGAKVRDIHREDAARKAANLILLGINFLGGIFVSIVFVSIAFVSIVFLSIDFMSIMTSEKLEHNSAARPRTVVPVL